MGIWKMPLEEPGVPAQELTLEDRMGLQLWTFPLPLKRVVGLFSIPNEYGPLEPYPETATVKGSHVKNP